jgi:cardiolipin synthase
VKRHLWLCLAVVLPILSLILFVPPTPFLAAQPSTTIVIAAVYYDSYETGEPDEAVQIQNISNAPVDVSGWKLSDGSVASPTTLPAGTILAPDQAIWLADEGVAFQRQFGYLPDFERTDTSPSVPNMTGTWPGFANTGDEVILLDAVSTPIDVLVYEGGNVSQTGWSGAAAQPYSGGVQAGEEGQILYRRRDQATNQPVPDTDTVADWAQSTGNIINGRKVLYPGWDLDTYFFTTPLTQTGILTIAVAPDNAYETLIAQINQAQTSIVGESHTFENLGILTALTSAATRGVSVTLLLEGGPPGGLTDQEKYICQELAAAGGQCWFMINDSTNRIFDRYIYIHAKFLIIDGEKAIISSENLSPDSLPYDDKSDGTWGRRGVVLITTAPGVVAHLQTIWQADFDPATHVDLFPWTAGHATYGNPIPGYIPITITGGTTYTVNFPTPLTVVGNIGYEIVQSPENSLRDQDALLGLLSRAGAGDTILVQQLSERPYWGPTNSNPTADPNPRLEAYVAAARRGVRVRLLLDEFFDDSASSTSNAAACTAINTIATNEMLDLECRVGNPTGLGVHNKMVLALIDGQGYVHIGSINGTENSNKANRELALQVHSLPAYNLLANMFNKDWLDVIYLPHLFNNFVGPATHPLISEVLYDPFGDDDAEFFELVNPTSLPINISNYSLGDAAVADPLGFEDVRRFPAGTIILPNDVLVIATSATAFFTKFGYNPDFEVLSTDPTVPDLIDDPTWGDPEAFIRLSNSGDELILRNSNDVVVDVLVYGTGSYPGHIACTLLPGPDQTYERYPYWRDTDNCAADFRPWPFPNPGFLP